jgi:hypothetical protein
MAIRIPSTSFREHIDQRAFVARIAWLALFPAAVVLAGAAHPQTPNNVDTGLHKTQCYDVGSNRLVSCASSSLPGQDGQLGRDTYSDTNGNADGDLGFSFTRVCNSGQSERTGTCPANPPIGDGWNEWACLIDNVTGIWWEVKADTGYRAKDLTYTDYSPDYDPVGQYGSPTDATGFVAAVNAANLCGQHDWNLSHTAKVQTIVHYGVVAAGSARVDTRYFPNTQPGWYWNDSPNLSAVANAWAMNFADGSVSNDANRATLRYVQVLRNSKASFGENGRYEILPDGSEVRDTTSNAHLIWQRCVEGMTWDGTTCRGVALTFTHEAAMQRAVQRSQATGQPWRVPSVKEQNWLVQRYIPSPPIEHPTFPNTPAGPHWASSPDVRQPKTAWAIDFSVGLVVQHPRTDLLYLRLARDSDEP